MLTLAATLNLVMVAKHVRVDIYDAMKPHLSGMSQIDFLSITTEPAVIIVPTSKNCTKYNCRCPYQDLPGNKQQESILTKANLMWTSEVETEIRSWKKIGQSSFPSLCVFPAAIPFEKYSLEDLRLIHHVTSISSELCTSNSSNLTIWVRQVPL